MYGKTPPPQRIAEWDLTLPWASSYGPTNTDTHCARLDLQIPGWRTALVTLSIDHDDVECMYEMIVGPFTIRTEWHAPGEHLDAAFRELLDHIDEIPKLAAAIKRHEAVVEQTRRERESAESES